MKIHSIRYGFATNSSSTHSVIFYKEPQKITDSIADAFHYEDNQFGWDNFRLATVKGKLAYFGTQLYELYQNFMPKKYALEYINTKWNFNINEEALIDHQSCLYFPLYKESFASYFFPNEEFINELLEYIKEPNVIVYGGNDNVDRGEYDWTEFSEEVRQIATPIKFRLSDILETDAGSPYKDDIVYAIKDEEYNFWTLFNWNKGTQIRFSFADIEIKKSSVPALIDLKITDYCKYNCDFCYQGSSETGKHAELKEIEDIIYNLNSIGVQEVAVGGGDPLEHPDFIKILERCNNYKIKPNFSTKQTDWLKDDEKRKEIFNLIGEVGISINSFKEFKNIEKIMEKKIDSRKVVYHIPMGTITKEDFVKILESAHWNNFLFLGYKKTGRGKDFVKINYDWMFEEISKMKRYGRIGIDTCIAKEFKSTLKEMNINSIYYQTEEGKFSMYIDAVTMKMARSSFDKKQIDIGDNNREKNILEFFKSL